MPYLTPTIWLPSHSDTSTQSRENRLQIQLIRQVESGMKRSGATAAALFVIARNVVQAEWYTGRQGPSPASRLVSADSRFNVYSVRKTYIGLVIANMILNGLVPNLDAQLGAYLQEPEPGLFANTTIRHLLTHTHGIDRRTSYFRRFAPGTRWHYTNAGVDLLCEFAVAVTGKTVREHIQALVWGPLGFRESDFEEQSRETLVQDVFSFHRPAPLLLGKADGAGRNLYSSARELAAWGYLHLLSTSVPDATRSLHDLAATCTLDPALFALCTKEQTPPELDRRLPRQGFFWWVQTQGVTTGEIGKSVPVGAFQILGMSGCMCLVIPTLDVVAVRMYNGLGHRVTFVHEARAFGDAVVASLGAGTE